MLCGMTDQVACKLSEEELRQASLPVNKLAYRVPELEDIIFLKSTSVLRRVKPDWIVYQEVYQDREKLFARGDNGFELMEEHSANMFYKKQFLILGITAIEPEWLPQYASTLCNISEPLKDPSPCYDEASGRVMAYVSSTFGKFQWCISVSRS